MNAEGDPQMTQMGEALGPLPRIHSRPHRPIGICGHLRHLRMDFFSLATGGSAALAIGAVSLVLIVVLAAVAWQVREGQRLADGPLPIAWEREACAHCLMHLSDPRFAVQLQTADGAVLNFDDPGCFFLYLAENEPPLHEVWFRDSRAERWLRRGEVGFVAAPATPMDLGLAAVAAGEPGALSYDAARARVVAGRDGRGS